MFGFLAAAIGSIIAKVAPVVTAIAGKIGTAIKTFADKALPIFEDVVVKRGPVVLDKTIETVEKVGQVCQVMRPEDKLETVGDRALQAGDAKIQPDRFDSYNDYMQEINRFEVNPQKSGQHDDFTKRLAGTFVVLKGVESKFNLADGESVQVVRLISISPEYFDSNKVMFILDKGINSRRMADYFQDKIHPADIDLAYNDFSRVEKNFNPNATSQDIDNKIMAIEETAKGKD